MLADEHQATRRPAPCSASAFRRRLNLLGDKGGTPPNTASAWCASGAGDAELSRPQSTITSTPGNDDNHAARALALVASTELTRSARSGATIAAKPAR
ncbi:MAG: hypothetical protein R2749_11940 [Acidimicrobiales bacterium]